MLYKTFKKLFGIKINIKNYFNLAQLDSTNPSDKLRVELIAFLFLKSFKLKLEWLCKLIEICQILE